MTDLRSAGKVGAEFVPFVSKVMRGVAPPSRPQGTLWPIGAVAPYFLDDLEALGEIFCEGSLFLSCKKALGWVGRYTLVGKSPSTSRAKQVTLWEAGKDVELVFTEHMLLLSELLYRLSSFLSEGANGSPDSLGDRDLSACGDLCASYWMFDTLGGKDLSLLRQREVGVRTSMVPQSLLASIPNPLVTLRWGPASSGKVETDLSSIFGPARPLMPWLIAHALSHWSGSDLGGDLTTFVCIRSRKGELVAQWIRGIARSGWLDLILPFMDLIERWDSALDPDDEGCATSLIVDRFPDERIADRQTARDAQAQMYLSSQTLLTAVVRPLQAIHPSDRSRAQKWFLSFWKQKGLEAKVCRLENVSKHLLGQIG